jgi:hypothetical protein
MPKNIAQIVSTTTTGTAPLVVASTTMVANLNVEKWGGMSLPSITGNGGKTLAVNTGATALEWITVGGSSLTVGPYTIQYNSGTNKLELIYTA